MSDFGLKEKLSALWQKLLEQAQKLNRREQLLIAGTCVALACFAGYQIYEPVQDAFDARAIALADIQNRSKVVSGTIEQYLKLKARREAIEGRYREVEFKEGALSHIESLIRSKAQIPSGYTIKDSPPRPFGHSYEQISFAVRFQTANMPALVDFLKEIVHGNRPLILGKINLQKSRAGDRLDVDLEMNSLRKVNG